MRILLINCFHYSRGGSETAYFDTAELLRSRGHEVAFFSMNHPQNQPTRWSKYFIGNIDFEKKDLTFFTKLRYVSKILFNFEARRKLEQLIIEFKPDVAHLHNINHQLSPSIIWALKKYRVPAVMTLHDYRLISPNYTLFHQGKVWEKRSWLDAIRDRVVKMSYLKTLVNVLEDFLHHTLLRSYDHIVCYVSPSKFLISKFRSFGFRHPIVHIPNPLCKFSCPVIMQPSTESPLVYYGRLSEEKGVSTLINAMSSLPQERLLIVGDGPEMEALQKQVRVLNLGARITFTGAIYRQELQDILMQAKAVIIPSVWYENMPYVLVEALALGKVVVASEIGGITEWITHRENGLLFKPGDSHDLVEKIALLNTLDVATMQTKAAVSVVSADPQRYVDQILDVYTRVILHAQTANKSAKKVTVLKSDTSTRPDNRR